MVLNWDTISSHLHDLEKHVIIFWSRACSYCMCYTMLISKLVATYDVDVHVRAVLVRTQITIRHTLTLSNTVTKQRATPQRAAKFTPQVVLDVR